MENNQQTIEREFEWKMPELVVGQEYKVAKYPDNESVKTTYIGKGNLERSGGLSHIFVNRTEDSRTYIIAEDHWLREINGVISYVPVSSFSIWFITNEQIRQLPKLAKLNKENKDLVNLLHSLGEKI